MGGAIFWLCIRWGYALGGPGWYRLSCTYNLAMHQVYRLYIPATLRYANEHKVLHFIGKLKPWHFLTGKVPLADDAAAYEQFYAAMVERWWDMRRSIAC
jgi:glycogenin glucosyltransferase